MNVEVALNTSKISLLHGESKQIYQNENVENARCGFAVGLITSHDQFYLLLLAIGGVTEQHVSGP